MSVVYQWQTFLILLAVMLVSVVCDVVIARLVRVGTLDDSELKDAVSNYETVELYQMAKSLS